MKEILEKNNLLKPPKIGDIVEGKIIDKKRLSIFLDLGYFGTGIIYGREYFQAKDQLKDLKIGDSLFAKIISLENEEGYIELSVSEAGREIAWENLKQKKEKNESLIVKISGANKGGLLTEIFGIPAFLPVSQLSPQHYPKVEDADPMKILRELQRLVGKELEVKIFDINPKTEKLILSEKAKEIEKLKEFLKKYKVGELVEGEISGLTNFGAFLKFPISDKKIPQLEGLIHISELDWKLIEDPSQIVKVGQKVKAKIVEISDDKVSLSLKALKKDPWKDVEKKYKKGDIAKGKVTKFNPFGVFVQITSKIQGLCHISQFGTKIKMEKELKIGEKYDFQILSIDSKEHRLNLKLAK